MKKFRLNKPILWSIFILLLLWLLGFVTFVIDTMVPFPLPPQAEGIVVLTGGAGRLDTAANLLEANYGKYLLISGVGKETTLKDLEVNLSHKIDPRYNDYITLGHNATSTMGNAIETSAWVHYYKLQTLIIVTSSYHIRRAILELQPMLQDTQLYPYVVKPTDPKNLLQLASMRLLFIEYNKFLMAYLGLIHTIHPKEDLLKLST